MRLAIILFLISSAAQAATSPTVEVVETLTREEVVAECVKRAETASKNVKARPAYLDIMETMSAAEIKLCHDTFFSRFKH